MDAQVQIWALLEAVNHARAPLHELSVITVPRRTGKTDALHCLAVGRCANIPGYEAIYMAQSGLKSRERFLGLKRRLRANDRNGDWRSKEGRGEERYEWENGSVYRFLPPRQGSFRGDAADLIVIDEGQEHDEAEGMALLGALLPAMDTRPEGQLVIAGTAGATRSGMLWTALSHGRARSWGIIEYAAPDDADADDPRVWARTHPGPAGLSREKGLQVIARRHSEMAPDVFAREYLGIWPSEAAQAAFSGEVWQDAGTEHQVRPRVGVQLGFDCTPERSAAAIACAWRDDDGTGHIEVLDARPGTSWLVHRLLEWSRLLRASVGYDAVTGSGVLDIADELARTRRTRLVGLNTADIVAGSAALASGIIDGNVRHPRQPPLDDAVAVAKRRRVGDAGWAWGRSASDGNISPLVAATVALRLADQTPRAAPLRVHSRSA